MAQALTLPVRSSAALVAAVAWVGLAVQFDASFGRAGSVALTIWTMLRFFTVLANLFSAVLFTGMALGKRAWARPFVVGGAMVTMLLVGIIYAGLLRGLIALSGGAKLADFLLHTVTPILVPLFWLLFTPKGRLRWRDPFLWAAFPLAYLPYALARGVTDGVYAYPFINVTRLGGMRVAFNAVAIAIGFVIVSFALIGFDHLLGRRSPLAGPAPPA